jgi:hypothetical protein
VSTQFLAWFAVVVFAVGIIYHSGRLTAVLERLADKSDDHDAKFETHGAKIAAHESDIAWLKRHPR